MAKYLSISTGDPNDTTQAFTSYWFLDYWTVDERNQFAEAYWGVYRAVTANLPAGAQVASRYKLSAYDEAFTNGTGDSIQVLFSAWQNGSGLVTTDEIFDNMKTLSIFWEGNGESIDMTTATELP